MTPDSELLRDYLENRSEEAFAELVRRHLDLVYSVALRRVNGDNQLAQDISQSVFTDLARKASALCRHPILTGWLYTSAHYAATKAVRAEGRRRAREQEAHLMRELLDQPTPEGDWHDLQGVLDQAMHRLSAPDREAVLLRYFENRKLSEIGARFGISENTARMRLERALEKLRTHLRQSGVTASAATLASALSANAVSAAPAGLAAPLAAASLTAAGASGIPALFELISMTKLKVALISALVIAGAATPLLLEHRRQSTLLEQNEALRQRTASLPGILAENQQLSNQLARKLAGQAATRLSLPAPPVSPVTAGAQGIDEESRSTNLIAQLLKGETDPRLTREQIETYLRQNHRNAASLITAYRATKERHFLEEAIVKYPREPQVSFAAVFDREDSPEEHRQRLESFKQTASDNSLPNYLSALDRFKNGQTDQAVRELLDAGAKTAFEDYSSAFAQNAEEAWLAAGYSAAEAKTVSSLQLLLPHLSDLKELSQDIVNLAKSYRAAGDEASASAAITIDLKLGENLVHATGQSLVSQLVGVAIERMALGEMGTAAPSTPSDQTAATRLEELTRQREGLKELVQQTTPLLQNLPASDWISYKDRWRSFGEEAALRWLAAKYRQNP